MKDENKTKAELIKDLEKMRQQIAELKESETERKKAEKELRKSKELLEKSFSSLDSAMFILDSKIPPTILDCNQATTNIFGYEKHEVLGKTTEFLHVNKEKLLIFQKILYTSIKKRGYLSSFDFKLKKKNGKVFQTEHSVFPLLDDDGNSFGWISVVKDITERKKAEKELYRLSQFQKNIIESANVWLDVLDNKTNVVVWNKAAEKISGYSCKEVIGHDKIWELLYPDEEYRNEVTKKAAAIIQKQEVVEDFETTIRCKDGQKRIISWNSRNLLNESGNPIGSIALGRDITERKKAEEALRESEERLRNLFEMMVEGVILIAPDGQIVQANSAAERILGLRRSEIEGRNYIAPEWEVLHPDGTPMPQEEMAGPRAMKENRPVRYVVMGVKRPDCSISWINVSATPLKNKAGGLEGIVSTFADITERREAEEALRQSERELRVRNQINSIFLTHPDENMYAEILKVIQEVMKSDFGTFGYFAEDGSFVAPAVTGKIFRGKCNVPEKDVLFQKGTFGGIWARAIKEKKTLVSNDEPFNTPKGDIPIRNTMVTPVIFRGDVISVIQIANKHKGYNEGDREMLESLADLIAPVLYARLQRDKQDKKRTKTEEALRDSEANLAQAQRLTQLGSWQYDPQTQKTTWSDEMFRIHGLDSEQGCPPFPEHKKLIHPEDWGRLNAAVQVALATGKGWDLEIRIIRPEGTVRIIKTIGSPQYSADGRVHRLVGTAQDITEHKRLEEQLQIRQRMDSLGTLAGGIAHDFNNLLTGIMGYIDMLNLASDNLTETQKDYISNALQSSHRAADLVRQLQTLSNAVISKKSNIDVYDIVTEVFNILKKTTDRLIEKEVRLKPGKFYVTANASEFNQVLLNLGTNAVQSISEGSAKPGDFIRVSAEDHVVSGVDITGLPEGEYVHITFEDNGCGMSDEVRRRAFDPLFTTKGKGGRRGQGLGLAMVFNIITRRHGGHIDIESEEGKGTAFHIYLPKGQPEEEVKVFDSIRGGDETVLIIEDEEHVSRLAESLLKRFGYKVLTASDGDEGLDMYIKNRKAIDLVLLDLTMPRMSGRIVFKRMLSINPDVKVIICSGQSDEDIREGILSSAEGFLKKPYRINNLIRTVRLVLDSQIEYLP